MFVTRIREENLKITNSAVKILVCFIAFVMCSLSATTTQTANAKPLPKKECQALKTKLKTLKAIPAVVNMSKGFEWVKANMKGDDLLPIKEFIETEEQYKFRCPQPKKKKTPKPKTAKAETKKGLDAAKKSSISKPIKKKAEKKAPKAKPKKKTSKKKPTPKKSKKKKETKKKSSLEEKPKSEPTLFETIFPSSVEYNNKKKS